MIRKPAWIRQKAFDRGAGRRVEGVLRQGGLHTVCESARCPNRCECFGRGTATFMILGNRCTRQCTFCAVASGTPLPVSADEPGRVARAVRALKLKHAVVTSVTRDDLSDGGAAHFAATVKAVRSAAPGTTIEVLVPDFAGSSQALSRVLDSRPDVLNHNLETVPRLYAIRPGASFTRSLALIRQAAGTAHPMGVKSGLMVGLGETRDEVRESIKLLFDHGCGMLTLGQYLQPSRAHAPVDAYITPEQFDEYRDFALNLGFSTVFAGPLVRSSYRAGAVGKLDLMQSK